MAMIRVANRCICGHLEDEHIEGKCTGCTCKKYLFREGVYYHRPNPPFNLDEYIESLKKR